MEGQIKNVNLDHIGEYKLDIHTANLMQSEPEFFKVKSRALARKRELQFAGFSVTIFKVTDNGGLIFA